MKNTFAIALHGGSGTIKKEDLSEELRQKFEEGLNDALEAGRKILENGGNSLDAVEAAVTQLENCSLFNAGKGSVFNTMGKHEMDAAIMDGKSLKGGAVAGVSNIKNPIRLCKAILQKNEYVFLIAEGAQEFAKQENIEFAEDDYFFDQHRYEQLQDAKKEDKVQLDHSGKKFGTVGAVALDMEGNLAAATSTGGLTNKKFGRVGDSPLIGCGTYANNATCAVSCTGEGEFFIRSVVAHDIACLMEYKKLTLQEACSILVYDKLKKIKGEGGLVAIDKEGNIAMPFNSEGMYRASYNSIGEKVIKIFKED